MIPASVRIHLEHRWGPVSGAEPVAGGCIHAAARLELDTGPAFLKWSADAPAGMFAAEARGLEALRGAGSGLRVPEVLDVWSGGLLLEWLEPAPRDAGSELRLGRGLAALHRAPGPSDVGDNWIGPLPQCNHPAGGWAEFWITRRLEPQLRSASDAGWLPGRRADWEALFARIPELLAPAERDGMSLLHGDLWSGNVLATRAGPALIDPAVYRGHREVDLAMLELFGGWGPAVLRAYQDQWPLLPGYAEQRRAVYQLYPLLVHVNLFGGAYMEQTARTLQAACF